MFNSNNNMGTLYRPRARPNIENAYFFFVGVAGSSLTFFLALGFTGVAGLKGTVGRMVGGDGWVAR